MLSEENGNRSVPRSGDELHVLSFSDMTTRKLVNNIHTILIVYSCFTLMGLGGVGWGLI